MKKIFLLLSLLITSCTSKVETINIICPKGAPSIAFYNYSMDSNFETNDSPNNIIALMNSKSDKNVIVVDTISGIKAIYNGAPYKIAATITFGNFYIAKANSELNNTFSEDSRIVLFGKNQTPDLIFHYLYGNKYDSSIMYVNTLEDAKLALIEGKVGKEEIDFVFIAEPALTVSKKLNSNIQETINIQDACKEKNNLTLFQASIFIKDNLSTSLANTFLTKIEKEIKDGITNNSLIYDGMNKLSENSNEQVSKFGVNTKILADIMPENRIGLGFSFARENKNEIDKFIALFNMEASDEQIYY